LLPLWRGRKIRRFRLKGSLQQLTLYFDSREE
jgi:hypothetical protein